MTYPVIKSIVALIAILVASGIFGWKVYQLLWRNLRNGQPGGVIGQWAERTRGLIVFVGGQKRLFRVFVPGTSHFFIFWGFLILFPTILQAMIEGVVAFATPHFVLPILGDFGPFALLQDVFAVLVMIAAGYGLYLRLVANPDRYKGSHKSEGVLVLIFIFLIMLSLLVMNGIRINLGVEPLAAWRPISAWVGQIFAGLPVQAQVVVEETSYWIHLGVVLVFLTMLPGGKHFHVVTSIPNVFLRNLDSPGRLPPAPEFDGEVGVSKANQFNWQQMLQFYSCTECGRCQDVCPVHAGNQALSPKLLMMNLRDHLIEQGATNGTNGSNGKSMVGDMLTDEMLWACTTCYACDQECPLFVEHITPIVNMRRHLVSEGRVDDELQDALTNLGRYGNSFGKSGKMRAKWARQVKPKIKDARKEAVDYLWFVGDYASYNVGLTDITQKTAEVFQKAGLNFGIMYDGEQNAGNDVRRVGEEGLFEMLVEKNMASLSKSNYQAIVTTDPHSFNTLKHEYPPELNGGRPVLHYTQLLDQLISDGKLTFSRELDYEVTYQDPCYLGRYNGIYDAPRRVIKATGCYINEMPRHGDRAVCCGAGGGRIWMTEGEVKERPSENRIKEAAALESAEIFVVACPKDITMFRDAVKTTGFENSLVVKDLIELVHEAL